MPLNVKFLTATLSGILSVPLSSKNMGKGLWSSSCHGGCSGPPRQAPGGPFEVKGFVGVHASSPTVAPLDPCLLWRFQAMAGTQRKLRLCPLGIYLLFSSSKFYYLGNPHLPSSCSSGISIFFPWDCTPVPLPTPTVDSVESASTPTCTRKGPRLPPPISSTLGQGAAIPQRQMSLPSSQESENTFLIFPKVSGPTGTIEKVVPCVTLRGAIHISSHHGLNYQQSQVKELS